MHSKSSRRSSIFRPCTYSRRRSISTQKMCAQFSIACCARATRQRRRSDAISRFLHECDANIVSSDQHSTDPEGGTFFLRMAFTVDHVTVTREAFAGEFAAQVADPLELSWRLRNCSLTEFVFTRGRVTLDSFNAVPHLGDAARWTYR